MQFEEQRVQWHFAVWRWLLENFGGIEALSQRPLVTPTSDFFPFRIRYEHEYFEEVFNAVKESMGLAEWPCNLEPLQDENESRNLVQRHGLYGEWKTGGPAGTFQWTKEGVVIQYSPAKINDPVGLVATLVHELCHYLLATAQTEPPGGWQDHEFHTDIACAFMGYGIFQSNSAFSFQQWSDADRSGWSSSRQGYLSESEHAFGLALFILLTGADPDEPLRHLKTNPRTYYKLALEDLEHRQSELAELRRIDGQAPAVAKDLSHLSRETRKGDNSAGLTITRADLEDLPFRDYADERLWQFYCRWTILHGHDLAALDSLPPPLRDLLLVIRLCVLQSTEGLQGTLLLEGDDSLKESEEKLRMTATAFSRFKDEPRAQFLLSLIPALTRHNQELDQAIAEDRLDEFSSPLDRDDTWAGLGMTFHHEMRKQVQWEPEQFLYPPASP